MKRAATGSLATTVPRGSAVTAGAAGPPAPSRRRNLYTRASEPCPHGTAHATWTWLLGAAEDAVCLCDRASRRQHRREAAPRLLGGRIPLERAAVVGLGRVEPALALEGDAAIQVRRSVSRLARQRLAVEPDRLVVAARRQLE